MKIDEEIFDLARQAAHDDLERVGTMTDEEVGYLRDLAELPDPETDGLECGHGMSEEPADGG